MSIADWLSRIWKRDRSDDAIPRTMPVKPRDPDAELAELAALLEGGDSSPEALERMAKLLGHDNRKL